MVNKKVKKKSKKPFPFGKVTIDYETTSLTPFDGGRPFIAGMEDEAGNVVIARPHERKWLQVRDILADPSVDKSAHNAKFERLMTSAMGWKINGTIDDTMHEAAIMDEYQKLSLDALCERHFKRSHKDLIQVKLSEMKKTFIKEHGREPNYSDVPDELIEKYLELDLDEQIRLDWLYYPAVKRQQWDVYKVERDLLPVVVRMEERGITVDVEHAYKSGIRMQKKMDLLMTEMEDIADVTFNPNSRDQVGWILEGLGLHTGQMNNDGTDKKEPTMKMGKELLHALKHPFAEKLVQYRALGKIHGTYLKPFSQRAMGDTLHPSFWQLGEDQGIKTGRFSSSNPNFQNLTRGDSEEVDPEDANAVRGSIVPREGYAFVFADYAQIEAKLFFIYADDDMMLNRLRAGEDVYNANASILFGRSWEIAGKDKKIALRKKSKTNTLGVQYGMGGGLLAVKLGITRREALGLKQQLFTAMPSLRRLMMSAQRDLLVNGFVTDFFGKRYHVPRKLSYKAVNAKCQGGAAGIMKRAMIRVDAALEAEVPDTGLVNIVHDEMIVETPVRYVQRTARILKEHMSIPEGMFKIPLNVDISVAYDNWANKKPLEVV